MPYLGKQRLRRILPISLLATLLAFTVVARAQQGTVVFLRDTITTGYAPAQFTDLTEAPSPETIRRFEEEALAKGFGTIGRSLEEYGRIKGLDDWYFYQLVRKTAQMISPKAQHYARYTLYKWLLLRASGYDALVTLGNGKILLYVRSNENVYNIPCRTEGGRRYVCLNYHDYGQIDFGREQFIAIAGKASPESPRLFSYTIRFAPDLGEQAYIDRDIQFEYFQRIYQFRVKLNPEVQNIFTNYPVVDYELQFNMPLSPKTYESLITSLRQHLKKKKLREGIEFLLHFTRYGFEFRPDQEVYGAEKRMSPEQTLLHQYSDCEDRAALFFLLVREIYKRPMLVLVYPDHVSVAVQLDKPYGRTIEYQGERYTLCEPSPQAIDLAVGQGVPSLKKQPFEVAYAYRP